MMKLLTLCVFVSSIQAMQQLTIPQTLTPEQKEYTNNLFKIITNKTTTPEVIKNYLSKGVSINAQDHNGLTFLHYLARTRVEKDKLIEPIFKKIDFLIANGASINAVNKAGETPLHLALQEKMVNYLVEHGAALESKTFAMRETPLHYASKNNLTSKAALALVNKKASLTSTNKYGDTPLHVALENNVSKTALALIDIMVEKGLSLNTPNNNLQTPLHRAARNGDLQVVKKLLEHGALLNAQDSLGATPLYQAVLGEHVPIIEYLVSKNANKNLKTKSGRSPFDIAKEKGLYCYPLSHSSLTIKIEPTDLPPTVPNTETPTLSHEEYENFLPDIKTPIKREPREEWETEHEKKSQKQ